MNIRFQCLILHTSLNHCVTDKMLQHNVFIIWRAKRAPHWAVQSRFRMIYMYICMSVCQFVRLCMGNPYKKVYAKMRGRNYVVQIRTCSKSVFGFETKCCLKSLILFSSGRLKPTCDTRIIQFYYTLEQR